MFDFNSAVVPVSWQFGQSANTNLEVFLSVDSANLFANEAGYKEIRTRNSDERSRFIKPSANQVEIETAIAGEGFDGTFKLRLRSISPSDISDIEGTHEFSDNKQVKYAEQYVEAGTYNIKTRQNDILNEAYVYCSFLKDNEFLNSGEFDAIPVSNNIGPNHRDDTTTQNNIMTFNQAGIAQMIMISSYHNTPASLIVELA